MADAVIGAEINKGDYRGHGKKDGGKNKSAGDAQPVTDGHIATLAVFFMLVYLGEGVGATYD